MLDRKQAHQHSSRLTQLFSDEVLLRVLHFLDARSLVRVGLTCRSLSRLAGDAMVWKALYATAFHSGTLVEPPAAGTMRVDWKSAYRTETNWRNGRFEVKGIVESSSGSSSQRAAQAEGSRASGKRRRVDEGESSAGQAASAWADPPHWPRRARTLVQTSRELLYTVDRGQRSLSAASPESKLPGVQVWATSQGRPSEARSASSQLACLRPARLAAHLRSSELGEQASMEWSVTEMVLDSACAERDSDRLVVFYSVSSSTSRSQRSLFAIFSISKAASGALSVSEEMHAQSASPARSDEPSSSSADPQTTVSATICGPLLVRCSPDFTIDLLYLSAPPHSSSSSTPTSITHLRTLKAFGAHWPACLSLRRMSQPAAEATYRLCIAYSSPLYPARWSVGLQQIIIALSAPTAASPSASITSSASRAASLEMKRSPLEHTNLHRRLPWNDGRGKLAALLGLGRKRAREEEVEVEEQDDDGPPLSLCFGEHSSSVLGGSHASQAGGYILVGLSSNLVDLYSVIGLSSTDETSASPASRSATSTRSASSLKLVHRSRLAGHTARVLAVSLATGASRAVSAAADGSVMIWSLGEGAEAGARLLGKLDAASRARELDVEEVEKERIAATGKGFKRLKKLAHVVTLRTPSGSAVASRATSPQPASSSRSQPAASRMPTLPELLIAAQEAALRSDDDALSIKWVGSTVDRIVSVSAAASAVQSAAGARGRCSGELEEERVLIWNFSN